jgi:hypothetical protein
MGSEDTFFPIYKCAHSSLNEVIWREICLSKGMGSTSWKRKVKQTPNLLLTKQYIHLMHERTMNTPINLMMKTQCLQMLNQNIIIMIFSSHQR